MRTNIESSFSRKDHDQAAERVQRALADEVALAAATRDYRWNVSGPQFRSLSELFGDQYHELDRWIDKLGERMRALGTTAHTSGSDLMGATHFAPTRGADLDAAGMMSGLIGLHDEMVVRLRADARVCAGLCHDPATAELLRALAEFHETTAWMLGELMEDRALVPV